MILQECGRNATVINNYVEPSNWEWNGRAGEMTFPSRERFRVRTVNTNIDRAARSRASGAAGSEREAREYTVTRTANTSSRSNSRITTQRSARSALARSRDITMTGRIISRRYRVGAFQRPISRQAPTAIKPRVTEASDRIC